MIAIGSRLCLLVAEVTLVAGSAFAQVPNPGETTPGDATTAPAQNLSKKLNQSNGVIHPKEVEPGHREAGAQNGRFKRGAAARDFRRRSRAAKMSALSRSPAVATTYSAPRPILYSALPLDRAYPASHRRQGRPLAPLIRVSAESSAIAPSAFAVSRPARAAAVMSSPVSPPLAPPQAGRGASGRRTTRTSKRPNRPSPWPMLRNATVSEEDNHARFCSPAFRNRFHWWNG